MYHVSAQGVDERMINVHYYYYDPNRPSVLCVLLLLLFSAANVILRLQTSGKYIMHCSNERKTLQQQNRPSCSRSSSIVTVVVYGSKLCATSSLLVECCFTSTETTRLIRDGSPGRPPRPSHSS